MKKIKKYTLILSLFLASILSFGFVDNFFEISKNLDIFSSLYKELNIFYVDENDGSLIVATDYSEIGDVAWGDIFSLDTSAEIGSGDQNTHNIVQGNLSDNSIDGFEFGSDNYAFKIVTELEYNGYSDWFIPSSGSMAVIFDHVHSRGMGNFDESLFYWSSTKQGYNPYVMAFNLDWGGDAFFGSCVDVNGLLIARKVLN